MSLTHTEPLVLLVVVTVLMMIIGESEFLGLEYDKMLLLTHWESVKEEEEDQKGNITALDGKKEDDEQEERKDG